MRKGHLYGYCLLLFVLVFFYGCGKETGRSRGLMVPRVWCADTKGPAIITTAALEVVGAFNMECTVDDAGINPSDGEEVPAGTYFSDRVVYSSENSQLWDFTAEHYWLDGVHARFWCWTSDAFDNHILTYLDELSSGSRMYSYAAMDDEHASSRSDVILAYSDKTWSDGDAEFIDITFHHPLVNIRFEAGDILETLEVGSLTLMNIKTQGKFVFNGDSSPMFVWSDLSGWSGEESSDMTETCSKSQIGSLNFFIPPQDLSPDTKLRIEFRKGDDPVIVERSLFSQTDESMKRWLPDHYYKYRINVSQDFSNPVEFDVNITLEGWGEETITDLTTND